MNETELRHFRQLKLFSSEISVETLDMHTDRRRIITFAKKQKLQVSTNG